ncbi:HD domain-containing protein [Nonomuraea insulae]|uniref:HD domain-containing protein n=1 Tax=Nonomuraea insulae TaxID=1616787 RepID=A0ABW1DCK1_9ACTN
MTGLLEPLLARLPADLTAAERDRIQRAYEFADRCHAGQVRKSGDPYITHPVAVAEIVLDVGLDCATVCAALLHDVMRDTECDAAQLRAEFGDEITTLVQSMTELDYSDGLPAVADELVSIARGRLTHLPRDTGATFRVLVLGALLLPAAVRASYLDEWLGELDVLRDRRARTRFAFRLALGMPALALTLRRPARSGLIGHLLAVLRWILCTDLRTWTPLTVLLGWMIVEAASHSLGDAAVIVITVPPILHAGVTRLRAKLGLDQPDECT